MMKYVDTITFMKQRKTLVFCDLLTNQYQPYSMVSIDPYEDGFFLFPAQD